jgi:23S rRNA pseudouridine1911/1915/1917 synthase
VAPPQIVFHDDWLVGACKPCGLPTQSGQDGEPGFVDLCANHLGKDLRVVHRIDQRVSGVVLFALDKASAASLSAQLRDRKMTRRYWAIVSSRPDPPAGVLFHRIVVDHRSNKTRVVAAGGAAAELHYRLVSQSKRYFLLDVGLVTGRHHQIRAQLAAAGLPVRGDLKYGARRSVPGGGIGLHAREVRFSHPATGEPVSIHCDPPGDTLWNALTADMEP